MIRALLVDDEPDLLFVLRRLLERSGEVEVVGEAGDGQQALEEAEKLKPDVVVLDYHMPHMDGLAVLRALQRLSLEVRVVLFTLNDTPLMQRRALAAGASALVSKAAGQTDLVNAVKAAAREQGRPRYRSRRGACSG